MRLVYTEPLKGVLPSCKHIHTRYVCVKRSYLVIVYLVREPRLFNQIGCHAVLTFVCLKGSLSRNIHRPYVFSSLSCVISVFGTAFL